MSETITPSQSVKPKRPNRNVYNTLEKPMSMMTGKILREEII